MFQPDFPIFGKSVYLAWLPLNKQRHPCCALILQQFVCCFFFNTLSDHIMRWYLAIVLWNLVNYTCLKPLSLLKTLTFPSSLCHPFNCSPLCPPSWLHQQRLCPSGELKKKEVGQEEEQCVSTSRMREERGGGMHWKWLHVARRDSKENHGDAAEWEEGGITAHLGTMQIWSRQETDALWRKTDGRGR